MAEQPKGCARVTGAVLGEGPPTAPAYYKGGFSAVQLSSFAGKWVLLCFYPGDFTFV